MVITIKNKNLKKVTTLDANLYPTSMKVDATSSDAGLKITAPKNAMYMIVE